eukprot:scaffold37804_cov67-Phaeocystis_antarctica.AAC.2
MMRPPVAARSSCSQKGEVDAHSCTVLSTTGTSHTSTNTSSELPECPADTQVDEDADAEGDDEREVEDPHLHPSAARRLHTRDPTPLVLIVRRAERVGGEQRDRDSGRHAPAACVEPALLLLDPRRLEHHHRVQRPGDRHGPQHRGHLEGDREHRLCAAQGVGGVQGAAAEEGERVGGRRDQVGHAQVHYELGEEDAPRWEERPVGDDEERAQR